jgi:hypothetical protein
MELFREAGISLIIVGEFEEKLFWSHHRPGDIWNSLWSGSSKSDFDPVTE